MLQLLSSLTLATLTGATTTPEAPTTLTAELAALTPAPAAVQDEPKSVWDFSYTFLELGASRDNLDEIDETADTYYARASLGLFDLLYVFGGFDSTDFEIGDTDLWRLGAGVHLDLIDNLDITGDIAWLYSDTSGDFLDETSNGHELRLGARWMPWRFASGGLELEGRGLWVDLDDSYLSDNSVIGFDIGARVHFLKLLSIGAYYKNLDQDDSASINARVSL